MPNDICRKLQNKKIEEELKKNSIYLLGDDLNERGFEFFVLIDDPDDSGKRATPFLDELYNVVINGEKCKKFGVSGHRNKLKELLGIDSDNDDRITPLNWLKIAIEQYPYRLFVVIDEEKWSKDGKSPLNDLLINQFIKKRICWIDKQEFYLNKGNLKKLKTWLAGLWIGHILRNIRKYEKIRDIFIRPHAMDFSETRYIPDTLPFDRDLKPKPSYDSLVYDLKNPGNGFQNNNADSNFPVLSFSRHGDFWEFGEIKIDKWDFNEDIESNFANIIYSENLSGSLSFFSQFLEALENPGGIKNEFFLLKLVEQSLFRIGIADERFQEWWGNLDLKRAGSILQSRLTALYWVHENLFGQKKFPRHNIYCCLKINDTSGIEWGTGKGEDFKELWPEDHQGIDMLLIHQGILDKWRDPKTQVELTKDILNLKDHFPFVVITSGRGRPENLPFGVKFIPFSGIEMCMMGIYFEKLTLFRQLMSLTSGEKNESVNTI